MVSLLLVWWYLTAAFVEGLVRVLGFYALLLFAVEAIREVWRDFIERRRG